MARYRKYGMIHPRKPGMARRIVSQIMGGVDTAENVDPAMKAVPRSPTVREATIPRVVLGYSGSARSEIQSV